MLFGANCCFQMRLASGVIKRSTGSRYVNIRHRWAATMSIMLFINARYVPTATYREKMNCLVFITFWLETFWKQVLAFSSKESWSIEIFSAWCWWSNALSYLVIVLEWWHLPALLRCLVDILKIIFRCFPRLIVALVQYIFFLYSYLSVSNSLLGTLHAYLHSHNPSLSNNFEDTFILLSIFYCD